VVGGPEVGVSETDVRVTGRLVAVGAVVAIAAVVGVGAFDGTIGLPHDE